MPGADMITAISAVIVSVAALFVAADQARVAREQAAIMTEQVHASVWPAVQISFDSLLFDDHAETGFRLTNAGVGPAIVKGVFITDGQRDFGTMNEIIALAPAEFAAFPPRLRRSTVRQRVLAPGEEVSFMIAEWTFDSPPDADQREAFETLFSRLRPLEVATCYCSAMDRCWISTIAEDEWLQETDSCTAFEVGDF